MPVDVPQVVTIGVDGEPFEFRPGEINGRIVRMVRAATGLSVARALQTLADDPDVDVLAAVVFAAALQADPTADFDRIEGICTYDAEYTVDMGAGELGEV